MFLSIANIQVINNLLIIIKNIPVSPLVSGAKLFKTVTSVSVRTCAARFILIIEQDVTFI